MATETTTSDPPAVVIDASFAVAYCAKEPGRFEKAKVQLEQYAADGCEFFAPGVLVAESLFVFCRKLADGHLTADEHAKAVESFETLMRGVKPPPNGEGSLIARAEKLRAGHGCSRSADSIYLALAEQLTLSRTAEIITTDANMESQAKANASTAMIKLLPT